MKKENKIIFIVIGLFIMSGSQIVGHYYKMPDLLSGILMGVGLGIMILSFIRRKIHTES